MPREKTQGLSSDLQRLLDRPSRDIDMEEDPLGFDPHSPTPPGLAEELRRTLNLQGDHRDARNLAILCRIEGPGTSKEICHKALAEGNWVLQAQALKSLAEMDPTEAESTALKILQGKPIRQVRSAALACLGTSKSNAALHLLLAAAGEGDVIWEGASYALENSSHPRVCQRVLEHLQAALAEYETLVPPPSRGKKKRIAKGASPTRKHQEKARKALLKLQRLSEILMFCGDFKGIEVLLQLTKHPDEAVRDSVLESFLEIGPEARDAVPLLIEALEDQDEDLRATIADALGAIGPIAPESLPALVRLLDDQRWWVQSNALEALENFGELAVGPLSEALESDNAQVRATAATALGSLGEDALPVLPQLIARLKDKSSEVRRQAVFALADLADCSPVEVARQAVPALVKLLKDKDKEVQEETFLTLRELGSEAQAAKPEFFRLLKNKNAEVRRLAVEGLGALGSAAQDAEPELTRLLKDRSPLVRESAAAALKEIRS